MKNTTTTERERLDNICYYGGGGVINIGYKPCFTICDKYDEDCDKLIQADYIKEIREILSRATWFYYSVNIKTCCGMGFYMVVKRNFAYLESWRDREEMRQEWSKVQTVLEHIIKYYDCYIYKKGFCEGEWLGYIESLQKLKRIGTKERALIKYTYKLKSNFATWKEESNYIEGCDLCK